MRRARVMSKTVVGSARSDAEQLLDAADAVDDGVHVDEAAGRGPALDAVLLEVDAERAQQVAAVAAIVLEERPQRPSGERLEVVPGAGAQQQPVRAELARGDDRPAAAQLQHQLDRLAGEAERRRVVVRAPAAIRDGDRDRPGAGDLADRRLELARRAPGDRARSPGWRPRARRSSRACSTARLRGARTARRSRTTSR